LQHDKDHVWMCAENVYLVNSNQRKLLTDVLIRISVAICLLPAMNVGLYMHDVLIYVRS